MSRTSEDKGRSFTFLDTSLIHCHNEQTIHPSSSLEYLSFWTHKVLSILHKSTYTVTRFLRVWPLCPRNNRLTGKQFTLNVLVRNTHTHAPDDASKRTVRGCEICFFYFRILWLIITSLSLIMNF
jgi:hypothetical protein